MTKQRFVEILGEEGWPERAIDAAWEVRPTDEAVISATAEESLRAAAKACKRWFPEMLKVLKGDEPGGTVH